MTCRVRPSASPAFTRGVAQSQPPEVFRLAHGVRLLSAPTHARRLCWVGELEGLSEHARANRAAWNAEASEWVAAGRRHWSQSEPNWGNWEIPEAQLRILPDVADRDVHGGGIADRFDGHVHRG